MPAYVTITLDTIAPANPSISIEGGISSINRQLVNCAISTTDSVTTGYQMKIWGNVDPAHNSSIQASEGTSAWIAYNTSQQIQLSSGDGTKNIFVKIRDDVLNESSVATDSISLVTTGAIVTTTTPSPAKISEIATVNSSSFTFSADKLFVEYKVKVVSATGDAHTTGTQIPTTAGSSNVSGTGSFPSATPITVTIKGTDLKTASPSDGAKTVKVFVLDNVGNWSV